MKIIIDNGLGSSRDGISSPDCKLIAGRYNREIARAIREVLLHRGYDAELLVPEPADIPNDERVERANRKAFLYGRHECFLVSIQIAKDGNGNIWKDKGGWWVSTFPGYKDDNALGEALLAAAKCHLKERDAHHRNTSDYPPVEVPQYLLKHAQMPAAVTFNFYLDNEEETAFLLSSAGRRAIIDLHVEGIINYMDEFYKKDWRFLD